MAISSVIVWTFKITDVKGFAARPRVITGTPGSPPGALWYNLALNWVREMATGANQEFSNARKEAVTQMLRPYSKRGANLGATCAVFLALVCLQIPAYADSVEYTNVIVVVTDAETNQPVSQAHLTLQFRVPGKKLKPKFPHHLSFSAKTSSQGRYRFTEIPKGTVHLIVTADRHQSLGKDFDVEKDNQVLEVKLKKPQPML